jgi:hypothetical protein
VLIFAIKCPRKGALLIENLLVKIAQKVIFLTVMANNNIKLR